MSLSTSSKRWKIIASIGSIICTVIGGIAVHEYTLWRAPERTQAGIETLLGLANQIQARAKQEQVSIELAEKLVSLEAQARSIEANLRILRNQNSEISTQADFWLPMDTAAVLGGTTSFGVSNEATDGKIYIHKDKSSSYMHAGERQNFKNEAGRNCFVTYVGRGAENLYGFKVACPKA